MNTKELREHVMMEVVPVSIRNEILALCDRVDELERDLKQYEWRPIETAPCGPFLILYHPRYKTLFHGYCCGIRHEFKMYYIRNDRESAICGTHEFIVDYPTHWIPLPQMPEDKWAW